MPELLVFRSAAPAYKEYPPWEALNTVTFEELSPGRTLVTVVVDAVETAPWYSNALLAGFGDGWGQSLKKLQAALVHAH